MLEEHYFTQPQPYEVGWGDISPKPISVEDTTH